MERQHLTLWQRIAYAHWSAKSEYDFPCIGWFLVAVAGICYIGLAFWFFEPEIETMMCTSAPHALGKRYFLAVIAIISLLAVSWVTVYIPFFIKSFFDKDEFMRKHFLKNHYRKP